MVEGQGEVEKGAGGGKSNKIGLEQKLNELLRLGSLLEQHASSSSPPPSSSSSGGSEVDAKAAAEAGAAVMAAQEQLRSLDPTALAEVVAVHASTKEEKQQVSDLSLHTYLDDRSTCYSLLDS
jgi:hypothetical protein